VIARVHLLDRNLLSGKESGLAQIYLPHDIIAQVGDPFIIRNSSGDRTLGGGMVVDPYPLHHRRRRENQIELVKRIAEGDLLELISAEIRKSPFPITELQLMERLNIGQEEMTEIIHNNLPGTIKAIQGEGQTLLFEKKALESFNTKIMNSLIEYHKKNPLKSEGRSFNELLGLFGTEKHENLQITLRLILQELENKEKLKKVGKTWSNIDHKIELGDDIREKITEVEEYFSRKNSLSIEFKELLADFSAKGYSKDTLHQILDFLRTENKILVIKNTFNPAVLVDKYRQILIRQLKNNPQGISVAEFRDLIKGNRAMALLLLEFFDEQGITIRKGNLRIFTKKFKDSISG
jgi:selenocysteine-specific elongation factor